MTDRPPFPAWLRELCYFGGIIVMLAGFLFTLKSKVDVMAAQLIAIESKLPNKEVDQLRYKMIEDKVNKDRSDWEFAVAKLEKWKDDTTRELIKKGVID